METTNVTKSALTEAIAVLSEAIAAEVVKNLESVVQRKMERAMEDYIEGQDFLYVLEDMVKDKVSDLVDEHVSNVSLRIEVD
jgi:transcription initiation factor IIF auxiliary subunit